MFLNKRDNFRRAGVSNIVFAISLVVLIIIAASGFALYATSLSHSSTTVTTTEMMSHSTSTTQMMISTLQNGTCACAFTPKPGAMILNAWLVSAPLNMGGYAVAIHAEGLEPNGTYLIEGSLPSGSMEFVPISNESMTMSHETGASEFQANSNGTGQFWIELASNPMMVFEEIELVYLPDMSMQNATVVAVVNLSSMTTMTVESMTSGAMTSESMSG